MSVEVFNPPVAPGARPRFGLRATVPYYRALAIDYDGTLTEGGPPGPDVMAALADLRVLGLRLILVTGRRLGHLRAEFPEVDRTFDLLVAENGAVLAGLGRPDQPVAEPLDDRLARAIEGRGVQLERGQVILAGQSRDLAVMTEEIASSGAEVLLVHNRDAVMLLPAGVSKGTGLFRALGELGLSFHTCVSVGDAENDHSLLTVCELGVAVASAVPALREHADLILDGPSIPGLVSFLRGPILRGEATVHPKRWRIPLGLGSGGAAVTVPASQLDLLIAGGSGSGKSFLAGLVVERLVGLGYTVCMLDPEGEHGALGELRGVIGLGSRGLPPEPRELTHHLRSRFGSVVVELQALAPLERRRYLRDALLELGRERRVSGLPHWIVLDEAQDALAEGLAAEAGLELVGKGHCLVTYQPERLPPALLDSLDAVVALPGLGAVQRDRLLAPLGFTAPPPEAARAQLFERGALPTGVPFELGLRFKPHVRHWHKYLETSLPPNHWFVFRNDRGPTGRSACNVIEFHNEIEQAAPAMLAHHLAQRDFSRWFGLCLKDLALATQLAEIEDAASRLGEEEARRLLLRAVERRYSGPPAAG